MFKIKLLNFKYSGPLFILISSLNYIVVKSALSNKCGLLPLYSTLYISIILNPVSFVCSIISIRLMFSSTSLVFVVPINESTVYTVSTVFQQLNFSCFPQNTTLCNTELIIKAVNITIATCLTKLLSFFISLSSCGFYFYLF